MAQGGKRVLAVASGGGHWEQLMMLRPVLIAHETTFATTDPALAARDGIDDAALLPDCNKDRPFDTVRCAIAAFRLVRRLRPHIVISTGAAPGLLCLLAAKSVGARTLWIDSVANAGALSLSGRMAVKIADECLTQWEHLASDAQPKFRGSVL